MASTTQQEVYFRLEQRVQYIPRLRSLIDVSRNPLLSQFLRLLLGRIRGSCTDVVVTTGRPHIVIVPLVVINNCSLVGLIGPKVMIS